MSDDDRMDDMIRAAAGAYNVPCKVPREEMWAVIEAAQKNRAVEPAVSPKLFVLPAAGIASTASRAAPHNHSPVATVKAPRVAWWNMAAAAALLIATGVGIGRWTTAGPPQRGTPAAGTVASAVVEPPAVIPSAGPLAGGPVAVDTPGARNAPLPRVIAAGSVSPVRSSGSARSDTRREIAAPGSQSAIPYQVATIRHLTDAEALLTSFTLESREQRTDSRLAGWAKGLLSNTRLLLDSPAGDDPRRAELLEDLELVLAQIVQLSPGAAAQERDLIDGSIRHGSVMTRLRTAIPAGPTRGF